MFTDKFIKVPIQVYDISQRELTGREESQETYMKMNPMEISRYNPAAVDSNSDQFDCVAVTFRDGETVTIYLNIDDFEKLINA